MSCEGGDWYPIFILNMPYFQNQMSIELKLGIRFMYMLVIDEARA